MLNSQEVIVLYEKVSDITDQMLLAARSGDWDAVIALESRCANHVEQLKTQEPQAPLPVEARESKVRIIKKILEDDRQIRDIMQPWMQQLAVLINSTGTERKLSKAYGSHS